MGIGLSCIGLAYRRNIRFHSREYPFIKKIPLLLQILLYLKPFKFIVNTGKLFSTQRIEELLRQASYTGKFSVPTIQHVQGLLILISLLAACFVNIYLVLTLPAAFFAPLFFLKIMAGRREKQVQEEQGLFTEVMFMSLRAHLNLRDALEEAAKSTVFLKPYLTICLNEWLTDKEQAMLNLKNNLPFPSFQMVVDLLIQVSRVGDERIIDFLEENKKLEDELKKLEITASTKIRPVLMTFQMVLPFGVILLVLFYPLLMQVRKILSLF